MAGGKMTRGTSIKTAETEGTSPAESPISEALRNELILQTISSFLPLPDKKRFRLVNSTWNRACLIEIRKQSGTIDLGYGSRLLIWHAKHLRETSGGQDPDMGQCYFPTDEEYFFVRKALIQLINTSKNRFPCVKFKLDQILEQAHFLHELLEAVSGFAQELNLKIHSDVFNQFPKNLHYSNLRCIKMDIKTYPMFSLDEWFLPILEKAPVLNSLSFETSCSNILLCCIEALDNPHGTKVKQLYLRGPTMDEHLNKLSQIGLSLTKLHLVLDESSKVGANSIMSVFESQSQSLKKLHVHCHVPLTDGELTISFPRMEKLESLEILFQKAKFPGLDYETQFPVLKQLSFIGLSDEYAGLEEIFSDSMKPLKTVEKLRLPEGLSGAHKIIQAAGIFPEVKKLEIFCSAWKLKVVGDHMKNVTELTYKFNYYDEDRLSKVFTGYTTEELESMEKEENEGRKPLLDMNRKPLDFFNKLKILRIEYAEISNAMCELGLRKLTNLKLLDLRRCRELEIKKQTLAEMRRKFVVLLPKHVRFLGE